VKRILIDCRFAGTLSGLGRYTREIATGLVGLSGDVRYALLVRSKSEPWLSTIKDHCDIIETNIRHYSLSEQIKLPGIIRAAKADLYFAPHFNVPIFCPVPFVATIHDLILHRYPNNQSFAKKIAYRMIIGSCVRNAKSLITISNFVREEIKDVYGENMAQKASVIWQGVDPRYKKQIDMEIRRVHSDHSITRLYFLYVGNAKQHKNVQLLIDAFSESGINDADLILVTGGEESKKLKISSGNIRMLYPVSDEDLPALYSGARAFVTATLYEGFCLPVAEALACGTAVIATNRSAIPEIAANKALLIEPTKEAFIKAFQSPPLAQQATSLGNWTQTVKATNDVIMKALA
jgi:glycosyltransferase involved in cell wall biosynthesis